MNCREDMGHEKVQSARREEHYIKKNPTEAEWEFWDLMLDREQQVEIPKPTHVGWQENCHTGVPRLCPCSNTAKVEQESSPRDFLTSKLAFLKGNRSWRLVEEPCLCVIPTEFDGERELHEKA